MYLLHERGSDKITFLFREYKFRNKVKNFLKYSGKNFKNLLYKRKSKPVRLLVRFKYRRKNPLNPKLWDYFGFSQYFNEPPFTFYNTKNEVMTIAEDNHNYFRLIGSDSVELKEITYQFIY
jgi:hypothetical protein